MQAGRKCAALDWRVRQVLSIFRREIEENKEQILEQGERLAAQEVTIAELSETILKLEQAAVKQDQDILEMNRTIGIISKYPDIDLQNPIEKEQSGKISLPV